MKELIYYSYGIGAILFTGLGLLLLAVFLMNWDQAVAIDRETEVNALKAVIFNLGLLLLFGLQHSIMARQRFKNWITQFIPPPLERSTYLYATTLVFILLILLWQPVEGRVWVLTAPLHIWIIRSFTIQGIIIVMWAVLVQDPFEFIGWRQLRSAIRNTPFPNPVFKDPFPYSMVRHPIYFGTLLLFWATPDMGISRLIFCIGMTTYIFIGIYYEERSLRRTFGEKYEAYQKRVPRIFPGLHF